MIPFELLCLSDQNASIFPLKPDRLLESTGGDWRKLNVKQYGAPRSTLLGVL